MFMAFLKGFAISASLIIAIGVQNAFVIRQGLRQTHLFLTASLCSIIDASLITIGVLGFGQWISSNPFIIESAKYFAIIFLFFYGIYALKSVFTNKGFNTPDSQPMPSRKKTIFLLMALGLLNPHVYLDTVILIGSIASQQPQNEQVYFALGAIGASFAWFFSLSYGSSFFSPYLRNPMSWKIINAMIALTMWGTALSLMSR